MPRFRLVLLLLALGAASPASAQEDTVFVEAIFRVDIDRGPSQTMLAAIVGTRLLLPLQQLLSLVEIGTSVVRPGRSVSALLQPDDVVLSFDTDSMLARRGDSVLALDRLDARWRDGDLYVYTEIMKWALGVEVGIDWRELIAVVGNTNGLPFAERARRERRRALLSLRSLGQVQAAPAPVKNRIADGAVLEWSLTSTTEALLSNTSAEIGVGAELLGGGIEMEYRRLGFRGGAETELRASWERAWPQQRYVRQVRVGEVPTSGLRSRIVRGAVVTNQPFLRSSTFDIEELVGTLPEGWEIELYDAVGLLDYGSGDPLGEFRVALPLRYGQNPFDMVMYGPGGEVVRRQRTIRVPYSRLPPGELEYAVGVGACRPNAPCGGLFSADARYGVNRHLTAQAGWDVVTRGGGLPDVFQPYVAASAEVLAPLRLTAEAVLNGEFRAEVDFEPTPAFRARLAQAFLTADGAALSGRLRDRRRTDASVQWVRYGQITTSTQASVARTSGDGVGQSAYNLGVAAQYRGGRYALNLLHLRATQPTLPTLVRTTLDFNVNTVLMRGPLWLRRLTVGGGLGIDFNRGLSLVRAATARAIGQTVRLDFGLGWSRDRGGFTIELGFTSLLRGPRFGSRNSFTPGEGAGGVQFFDGSMLWDRGSGRLRFGDGRDVGRGGLTGIVYLDLDGDGTRGPDEPGLPEVPVRVAGWRVETDSSGSFSAWDLLPFQSTLITVDTSTFDNPFYVMRNRVYEVAPTPNSFVQVEIPVVIGAEVSGGVLYNDRPLAGVRVEFMEVNTGQVIRLTTFADGGFYVMGVPPGEWVAAVTNGALDGIGARSPPVRFTVPAGAGMKLVDALVLTVVNGNGGGNGASGTGIAGTVFLDLDSDGVLDEDEPILPEVALSVGGRPTQTDLDGRFAVSELQPFEPATVEVDSAQFDSPAYVVENRVVEVTPAPGQFVLVDIPVVIGAEVSGGVLLNGQPVGGVPVELRKKTTGTVTALTTSADGGFYTIGLPPGDYEAYVPAAALDTLGATSAPVSFSVPATGREKYVDAVILTLER